MTIYVVTSGEYSDYAIDAVFLDRKKAEQFCAVHNTENSYRWYGIEEYETADDTIQGEVGLRYVYEIRDDDMKASSPDIYTADCDKRTHIKAKRDKWQKHRHAVVVLKEDNPEKAFKIAQDLFAKAKSEDS